MYLCENVTSSCFNIDFDRLEGECSCTHADRMTVTEGQKCVGRHKEENQLTEVIKLQFVAIRMSENVTLTRVLMERNSHERDRRRKQ